MKQMLYGVVLSALVTTQIAVAAETSPSWLCVSDQATGFAVEDGAWRSVQFKPKKYLLRVRAVTDFEDCFKRGVGLLDCPASQRYVFSEFGEELGDICQSNRTHKMIAPNMIICSTGVMSRVFFNKQNLRFSSIYNMGYVQGDDPGNTPSITIGKCTPL